MNLAGLHCVSCAANIDLTLEDVPGIIKSETSYAKMTTVVTYEHTTVNPDKIISTIIDLGYQASPLE